MLAAFLLAFLVIITAEYFLYFGTAVRTALFYTFIATQAWLLYRFIV